MYSYTYDIETGGLLLNSSPLQFSKEPRPVYYREMDILGFDAHWQYEKNDVYPYMWAEANNYWYRGKLVAKTKGGALYTSPEVIFLDDEYPIKEPLRFVDIPAMVAKNAEILESLTQATIKKIYNSYIEYQHKVDVFYVAFSGGKDSIVVFDLVQRALPHNAFRVLFGNTGMEFPDTYILIETFKNYCAEQNIAFYQAESTMCPGETWDAFGPPSVTNRWCCSVHKTSPQITILKRLMNKDAIGMAFTGIRGAESLSRNEYEDISFGKKHSGQYSCHPILEWNSAELFCYIFQQRLLLNDAYRKGISRVGCLVCPMSSGLHEYMKHIWYPEGTDFFYKKISETSGKNFSLDEMRLFIESGNWKTRKSGRELNFGLDKFCIETKPRQTVIKVSIPDFSWEEWGKTLGRLDRLSENEYIILFRGTAYKIGLKKDDAGTVFTLNAGTDKEGVRFQSLFKSVIIKSIYCISCGVCAAECKYHCIDFTHGVRISDRCIHCGQCHEIHEHCLRYNSIRNKPTGGRTMKGLDRYFTFGFKQEWLSIFLKYDGKSEFWNTDGDSKIPNKKKDAFLNFAKDAHLVFLDKSVDGDKYTKNQPTSLVTLLQRFGSSSSITWGLLLCNLAYTPEFNWFVRTIPFGEPITTDRMKFLLESVMENDSKGLGKRNVCSAFKTILVKTPLGAEIGLGDCDYLAKGETITLNSFFRKTWSSPEPLVILYALYKFAEACKDYYQFTLTRLLDHEVESDGVSPTQIFGLSRETMEKLLNGLAINYPEFISVSFNLDLDNITLRNDKTSADVLNLF